MSLRILNNKHNELKNTEQRAILEYKHRELTKTEQKQAHTVSLKVLEQHRNLK